MTTRYRFNDVRHQGRRPLRITQRFLKFQLILRAVAWLISLALLSTACGPRRTPDLDRIFAGARARTGKRPVIVIPGVLGSQLINKRTNEVVWPSLFRSSDDGLNLPVTSDLAANRDELVASKIIETAKLAKLAPEVYVYRALILALKNYAGYREGDWASPPDGGDQDTFYVFPYDWRRDNVETARTFVQQVEELKRKLGRPDLRFNIVAHSMGGLIARYAAMYGDRDLPEEGTRPTPTWDGARHLNKVFMFGTPNEGSAEAFATLTEGYSVTEGLRRRIRLLNKLTPEDVFTAPSIFQLMPHAHSARFLDENLQQLDIDLYEPSVWRRYGWGAISDEDFRSSFARGETKGQETSTHRNTLEEADAYFAAALRRARGFHEALDAIDAQRATAVPLFAFGGDCEETLAAPIVLRDEKKNRWVTLSRPKSFENSTKRKYKRKEVQLAMFEPGDGRITRRSLLGQGAANLRNSVLYDTTLGLAYAAFACELHSDLQSNKTLQDNALTLLVNELTN